MADAVDELLARNDLAVGGPARRTDVDDLIARFGGALPASLGQLWSVSDGITLDSLNAHLLGPTEVKRLIDAKAWSPELVDRGFLPVLDDHQSNFLAVILHQPLAFRVAHLPHDDGSRLLYRDLDSFIHALDNALEGDEPADTFFSRSKGDYAPDAPRAPADQSAARLLMATDGTREEWNYAAQLLDAGQLAEWTTLLETDHFVRRDVVARMETMTDPAIRQLLHRDRMAFEEFAHSVAEAAREAGLEVGRRERDVLQVGGKWMNLDGFYHRRHIASAIPRMIAWFEDQLAGRNPRERRGHFLSD